MRSNFQVELPERGPEEPNATEKQIHFIEHLLDEIDAKDFSLDIESLGKWQASSLINRLNKIQNGKSNDRIYKKKKRSNLVWYAILVFIVWLLWIWLTK